MIPKLGPIPEYKKFSTYVGHRPAGVVSQPKMKKGIKRKSVPRVSTQRFTPAQAKLVGAKDKTMYGKLYKDLGFRKMHKRILSEDLLKSLGARIQKDIFKSKK